MEPLAVAGAGLAALTPVLDGLTDADRTKPTPCDDMDCHGLAEHLLGGLVGLGGMAGATITRPEDGSLSAKVTDMTNQVIAAWRERGTNGMVAGPGGHEMPAIAGPAILSIELLLHAWDFAQASGQTVNVTDDVVAATMQLAGPFISGGRQSGAFGPEVEAPAGASPLDKLAAFSGRKPLA